jgi:hypothetical protein
MFLREPFPAGGWIDGTLAQFGIAQTFLVDLLSQRQPHATRGWHPRLPENS